MNEKSEAEKLMESLSSQLDKTLGSKNAGHDSVSVDEKKVPERKKEAIPDGFSENELHKAEMYVKFDVITKQNFTEKIVDLQNFFIDHPEMLSAFKELLATLLRNENAEFIKIQGAMREKKSDDSFIMKGEMEGLEDKYHKIGAKINLLTNIRKTFFK